MISTHRRVFGLPLSLRVLLALLCLGALYYLLITERAGERLFFAAKTAFYADSWEGRSVLLREYRATVQAQPVAGVEDDLSGLTFDSERGHLWAVINAPPRLLALDTNGQVLHSSELLGFQDTEAIAYIGDGLLAVVEERRQQVVMFPAPDTAMLINREGLASLQLDLDASEKNDRYEGLGYDAVNDRLYLVKERRPMAIIEIDGLKSLLQGTINLQIRNRHDLVRDKVFSTDLSGVAFDPATRNMLLLSDESKLVMEIHEGQRVVAFRSLTSAFAGLEEAVPQAEGLTIDNEGNLYLVSEPNLFYRFSPIN